VRNAGKDACATKIRFSDSPIPKPYSFYTKIAKSAKKLASSNSFFADLATFV
jgi:hypothetical protein